MPELAKVLGAEPPRRLPTWFGRIVAGESGVYMHNRTRGISNARAKVELGWDPLYASWRDGFRHGIADIPDRAGHEGKALGARRGMKPVTVSVTVPDSREEVYDFLDVLANHEPFTNHMLVDWHYSGPRSGVGARARMRQQSRASRTGWIWR